MKNDSKFIYFVRMLAGGYLLYLAIPMLKNVLTGSTQKDTLIITLGSIFFLVVAIVLIAHSVWSLIRGRKNEDNLNVEVIEEKDIVDKIEEKNSDN